MRGVGARVAPPQHGSTPGGRYRAATLASRSHRPHTAPEPQSLRANFHRPSDRTMPRPWRPAPLLQASALLHAGALGGVLAAPALWPWALAALVANHATITTAGLLPRCTWLGPTLTRLPPAAQARQQIALTIDDGPDPAVTPRVLDLLDAAGARASFFCIADRARAHPALVRDIVARGHSVENHSDTHPHAFSLYGPRRMRREISAAQASLAELAGAPPRFFRAPAGLRNPFLEPVLADLDLSLAAWTRRAYDTRCADPELLLDRLTHGLAPGDILLLHDGHSARDASGEPVILTLLPPLLAHIAAAGLHCGALIEAIPAHA